MMRVYENINVSQAVPCKGRSVGLELVRPRILLEASVLIFSENLTGLSFPSCTMACWAG